jgi:hypothetical protein
LELTVFGTAQTLAVRSREGAVHSVFAEKAVLSHGHIKAGMSVLTEPFAMEALASRAGTGDREL